MPKAINPVKSAISRKVILDEIRIALEQSELYTARAPDQISDHDLQMALKWRTQAETLIELLEVDDCGSKGGFDEKRGQIRKHPYSLRDRYEWLFNLISVKGYNEKT